MKLTTWKRRKYVPKWGGNFEDDAPCSVLFTPPTIGWMARWRELVIQAPAFAKEATAALENGEAPSLDWEASVTVFREELIRDLVVAVDDLFDEDRAMPLDKALDFIVENPGLRDEVFEHIIGQGQVTTNEGKD